MPESCVEFKRAGKDALGEIKNQEFCPNGVSWRVLGPVYTGGVKGPCEDGIGDGKPEIDGGWASGKKTKRLPRVKFQNSDPLKGNEDERNDQGECRYRIQWFPLFTAASIGEGSA